MRNIGEIKHPDQNTFFYFTHMKVDSMTFGLLH